MSFQANLRTILSGLAATAFRFPLPLGAGLLYCATEIAENHGWLPRVIGNDGADRMQALAVLGFFLTLSIKLFVESHGWGVARHALLATAGVGLLALKLYADQPVLITKSETILFLGPATVLLAMVAPFISPDSNSKAFWDFDRTSWLGAALAFLAALILAAGIMFALWAIEELFGWRVPYRLRSDITTVCFAIFCPWLALSRVPRRFDAPGGATCPRALSMLIAYVLVPLAVGYSVIVYAYLARILALWELPQGQVGVIVSGYAGFGIATYLAVWPLRELGPLHVRLFHRYFHYALALPVALLAVAVAERISAHGVTEARYVLGVIAAWLAVTTAIFIWRRDRQLTLLPLALAVLLAVTSFGPWGAASVSLRSQTARLASLLKETGLYADGRVLRTSIPETTEPSDRRNVVSIVRYLDRTGRLDVLDGWFEEEDLADDANPDDVLAAISEDVDWKDWNTAEFAYSADTALSVAGYDHLLLPRTFTYSEESDGHVANPDGTSLRWTYRRSTGVFWLYIGTDDKVSFDLAGLVGRMRERHGDDWAELADTGGMILDDRVGLYDTRLWVERLRGSFVDGRPAFWEVQLALLLRAAETPAPTSDSPD